MSVTRSDETNVHFGPVSPIIHNGAFTMGTISPWFQAIGTPLDSVKRTLPRIRERKPAGLFSGFIIILVIAQYYVFATTLIVCFITR